MKTSRHSIGIVGGLCPLATADIYFRAMKKVKASSGDMDYPDIIINAALEQDCRGNQFSSEYNYDMHHRVLYIYQVAKELKDRGVDKILIPDFLSYTFAKTIHENIRTPLVDIVEVLVDETARRWPSAKKIGFLTTKLSISNKVFDTAFGNRNMELIFPDPEIQENMVMEAVYGTEGVKKGFLQGSSGKLIQKACSHLFDKGVEVIISGITELPLIDRKYYPKEKYLDCNDVIAAELVKNSGASSSVVDKHCVIGILGGLGPYATVDIFDKIVKNTAAAKDQDHIKVIIENNPQIPDRTAALRGSGEDPGIALLATAEKLQSAGADFIIVPCNTAHVFMESVQQHIRIPVLSMIEETAKYIIENFPSVKTVGLLATSGTVGSKVYETQLDKRGLKMLVPATKSQEKLVMEAIYGKDGIKAGQKTGKPRDLLQKAARELAASGAALIILGCTEIPLVLKDGDMDIPFIDPTEILAKSAVRYAINQNIPRKCF